MCFVFSDTLGGGIELQRKDNRKGRSWAGWHSLVISALREAESGGSL